MRSQRALARLSAQPPALAAGGCRGWRHIGVWHRAGALRAPALDCPFAYRAQRRNRATMRASSSYASGGRPSRSLSASRSSDVPYPAR